MSIASEIKRLNSELPQGVKLVAVSKYHPAAAIMKAYDAGQRLFGENRPQELYAKCQVLPSDIRWHFIGHLQTNKLKMVLPYASLVESVDSVHLLEEIDRWGRDNGRKTRILLELHLGAEETKHGMSESEILDVMDVLPQYPAVIVCGLMGMATNTDDEAVIRGDFERISELWSRIRSLHPESADFTELSIGMSEDYALALEYGATIVRIGTKIFGPREYESSSRL